MHTAPSEDLLEAALELSAVLTNINVAHAIIGATALALLGSTRLTRDVDVLVDSPGPQVRSAILNSSRYFAEREDSSFIYTNAETRVTVPVGILEHGEGTTLKLPDLSSAPTVIVQKRK
ncbi:hypothetical protein DRE_02858 [Drechslerella stenobrocha 248]|uniref:Uncharacterized protein n=1 Tax=Drechslerella stenobrocha 248 TaxID=1043628 RepID=W7HUW9_9PEZI|nr:hypothetical protein DRE_02858 [Drechslerella stenobrocha 248]